MENCADGKWNEAMSMLQPLAGLRPNCYWTLLQVHNPYFGGRRDAHELTLFLSFLQILPQQPKWTSPLDSTNKALILLCLKRVLEGLDALGLSQLSRPTVMQDFFCEIFYPSLSIVCSLNSSRQVSLCLQLRCLLLQGQAKAK